MLFRGCVIFISWPSDLIIALWTTITLFYDFIKLIKYLNMSLTNIKYFFSATNYY